MGSNFEMTKTTRIVMYGFIAFCFLFPLVSLLSGLRGPGSKELILIDASKEVFHGKVDSIYHDKRNHNVEIAVLSDLNLYEVWPEWESKIELNDSISKKNGSFKVEVYKKNGIILVLDYKELLKKF